MPDMAVGVRVLDLPEVRERTDKMRALAEAVFDETVEPHSRRQDGDRGQLCRCPVCTAYRAFLEAIERR